MNSETPVEKAREAIAWHLQALGVKRIETMHETMLIRNGLFCGRKFECEQHQVVWFLEEDEIKFFSPVGEMLKATSALECIFAYENREFQEQRRAA